MRPILLLLCGSFAIHAQPSPETLLEEGHGKRARALVEANFAARPTEPETLYLMSWVKQQMGDAPASVQLAEKAVAAEPKSARYHFRLAQALGEEAQKASAFKQLGLGRRFKKEVDAVLALDPKHVEALIDLMQFQLQAPGILGGDKAKAHAIPARIMAIDPVRGYFAEVALARHDKQPERIEELCRKAVEVRPGSYDARLTLAVYFANTAPKRPADAETQAREALKINPGRIGAHNLLAGLLASQDRWNELDAALAQAEKEVPDNLTPYLRAANQCLARGVELPRAERYIRKYLSQDPELGASSHAVAHWRLGVALEKQGRKPEAIVEYQMAVKLDPASPAKQDLKRL